MSAFCVGILYAAIGGYFGEYHDPKREYPLLFWLAMWPLVLISVCRDRDEAAREES